MLTIWRSHHESNNCWNNLNNINDKCHRVPNIITLHKAHNKMNLKFFCHNCGVARQALMKKGRAIGARPEFNFC